MTWPAHTPHESRTTTSSNPAEPPSPPPSAGHSARPESTSTHSWSPGRRLRSLDPLPASHSSRSKGGIPLHLVPVEPGPSRLRQGVPPGQRLEPAGARSARPTYPHLLASVADPDNIVEQLAEFNTEINAFTSRTCHAHARALDSTEWIDFLRLGITKPSMSMTVGEREEWEPRTFHQAFDAAVKAAADQAAAEHDTTIRKEISNLT